MSERAPRFDPNEGRANQGPDVPFSYSDRGRRGDDSLTNLNDSSSLFIKGDPFAEYRMGQGRPSDSAADFNKRDLLDYAPMNPAEQEQINRGTPGFSPSTADNFLPVLELEDLRQVIEEQYQASVHFNF